MLLDDLHKKKQAIEELANACGATRIRVFGSVARGEERPDSDVDFLVAFPEGYDLFTQRLQLTSKLSQLVGRSVDLIPEHELNRHFRDSILNESTYL